MSVEKKHVPLPDSDETATALAPGVWVTDASGFACVPPRAQSDLRDADRDRRNETDERAIEKEPGGTGARDDVEPRIEQYRER